MTKSESEVSSPKDGWTSAKDILAISINNQIDPLLVKNTLADFLRDGFLRVRVSATWISEETLLSRAIIIPVAGDVERNVIIEPKRWKSDKWHTSDRDRWRWPTNIFFHTLRRSPFKRRIFRGVSFSNDDLNRLRPDWFGSTKPQRGRKHDTGPRDLGWLEVVELALSGELQKPEFETQARIAAELEQMLAVSGDNLRLGKNQIAEIAYKTASRLRAKRRMKAGSADD